MNSDVMTRLEAAAYLALDRQGLRDPLEALRWLCRTGRLRHTKVGRRVCFRKAWLDELLERDDSWKGGATLSQGQCAAGGAAIRNRPGLEC